LNDSTYQGGIAFEMHTNNNEGRKEHINFTVRKIQKNFGTEEKLVWETYLEMNK
jgi:hypothetical protein